MNVVTRPYTQRRTAVPALRLPIYVRLMLILLAFMNLLVIGLTTLQKQRVQSANPLAEYDTIMPGQPRSAVMAMQFLCMLSGLDSTQHVTEYCTRSTTTGPFSQVAVTLSDGVVRRPDFTMRNRELVVGQLALAWGRPRIQIYGHSLLLKWPEIGAQADGWAENEQFSYFIPILRLSISPSRLSAYHP